MGHQYVVRHVLNILVFFCLGIFPTTVQAAHTQARLLLNVESAKPGDTILAGVHLKMDAEWHTYWKNSGASGIATSIKWDLPDGLNAGEIQWPVPKKLPPDDLTTYAYEDEVLLIVPLTLSAGLKPGPQVLKATVSWLECKDKCIPGSAEISATFNVGTETKTSPEAATILAWQKKLPGSAEALHPHAWWENQTTNDLRALILEWDGRPDEADLFPLASDSFEVQGEVQRLPSDFAKVRIRKLVKNFQGEWPKEILGLLVQLSGTEKSANEATLTIGQPLQAAAASLEQPLWKMLIYAFIGGLILNIMPCVLPVIALKILGFVAESKSDPRHVRKLGLIYALGVLASFLALAALVLSVKAAGHKAGWGMQFSSPEFMVVLTTLVTLVGLNLFGVFEVTLSGGVMGAAGNLASKQGAPGAFFNGVLATVLATPCTAPFLGVSLGFAFAQTAPITVLMFLTVGLGLAFPYVILTWQPGWLKFLPKPGAWMEKFKIAMGFPILATAFWLFSLVSIYYGERAWWLGIFLIIVSLAAWMFGEFVQRGSRRRGLATALVVILLVVGYVSVVEGRLRWRELEKETGGATLQKENADGVDWQRWSHEAIDKARAEGRPVLVDFTAKWCLTCNTLVKPALESASVRAKLKELNAVALLADYTRFPPEITEELARFGRAGVPMVLIYPKNPAAPPVVLPEALTPGTVLDALEQAAK